MNRAPALGVSALKAAIVTRGAGISIGLLWVTRRVGALAGGAPRRLGWLRPRQPTFVPMMLRRTAERRGSPLSAEGGSDQR
jgi:hypothetical protein